MSSTDNLHVFERLSNLPGIRLQRSVELGDGLISVIWQNHSDASLCLTPDHYTLASYLPGRVHNDSTTSHHAAPKGLCMRAAGYHSAWTISHTQPLAHLYISREQFALSALQLLDREPRELQWGERRYLEQPQHQQHFRQLFQLNWQEPAERLLGNSMAHDLIHQALLAHTDHQAGTYLKGGLTTTHRHRIVDYIQSNLTEAMTLSELAHLCGLSEYHFARMFHISFGVPPHRYVLAQRLQHARQLLRHSSRSLTDIAYACGFASQSHFNNRFKQALGATPGQYRSAFKNS